MPNAEQDPPTDSDAATAKTRTPWFRPNKSGPGWHPSSWQGGLIVAVVVTAIVTVVVLFRIGVL
jgi:hypothetical protein